MTEKEEWINRIETIKWLSKNRPNLFVNDIDLKKRWEELIELEKKGGVIIERGLDMLEEQNKIISTGELTAHYIETK